MFDPEKYQKEFLQMLESCESTIFKVCLTYTDRTPEEVQDLFQEIVCNMWDGYGRFRHDSSDNTWVYRVAVNTARQHRRSRMRRSCEVVLDSSVMDTFSEPEADHLIERLYGLIDQLSEDEKKVILPYLDGKQQKEIANELNCSEYAVNQKISRLKKKLNKINGNEPE